MKFRSILLAEARGSMAGATFSRNGNSAYVRARATPVNPRTSAQTVNRDALNSISTAWRALTQPERQSWIALAKTVPYTNSLGESAFYSGFQLFMKCNLTIRAIGGDFITNAPATPPVFGPVSLGTLIAEQDGTTFSDFSLNAFYTSQPADVTQLIQIDATGAMSAGKLFVAKSQYRSLTQIPLNNPTAVVPLGPVWAGVFGVPTASLVGSRINVRARIVSITTGFTSPWLELTAIVTEA